MIIVTLAAVALAALAASPAFALPERRVYEMVSQPYKAGYGVFSIAAVAPDGESVAYQSQGTFAGAPRNEISGRYLAHRGPGEWSTSPLEPSASLAPAGDVQDFTPDLGAALYLGCTAANYLAASTDCQQELFFEHVTSDTQDIWAPIGPPLEFVDHKPIHAELDYEGASADFCHILARDFGSNPLTTEPIGQVNSRFYDLSTGCTGESGPKLIGLSNAPVASVINPYCSEEIGGLARKLNGRTFNWVSRDGSEVFFSAYVEPGAGPVGCASSEPESAANPAQVFVRLGGSRTVEVSRPAEPTKPYGGCKKGTVAGEVPCDGASTRPHSLFWGASEDGTRVFFSTAAPLVAGDSDTSENLYMATIGCPPSEEECEPSSREVTSLTRVSAPQATGEEADLAGVVKIAPDGSHVYFVASGVLSGQTTPERTPVKGADNLYAYDIATGTTAFIADLCSGPLQSGSVEDLRCPTDVPSTQNGSDFKLWAQEAESEAAINVCARPSLSECTGERETGRFLAFSTFGRLLKVDTDGAKDVYRYDTQTGMLTRVSGGEADAGANGNCTSLSGDSNCDATIVPTRGAVQPDALYAQHEMADRAITENGERIVFSSAGQLSAAAVNKTLPNEIENVYEWRLAHGEGGEGRVSIVSSGASLASDQQPVIDPSGRDVYFMTTAGLVTQDTDGQYDIYDARLGGGFPVAPLGPESCEDEGCYGPLTTPAPLLIPGSVPQSPGGNFALPAPKPAVKAPRAKRRKKARKVGKGRRGRHASRRRNRHRKGR